LKAVERNPVDFIWGANQPAAPAEAINPHPVQYSGESHTDKITKLRKRLGDLKAGAMVVTMLDEVRR
jgi:Xaa-Pro aminopeptidase